MDGKPESLDAEWWTMVCNECQPIEACQSRVSYYAER